MHDTSNLTPPPGFQFTRSAEQRLRDVEESMNPMEPEFTRLAHEDGTISSVCRKCFATVATTSGTEAEVERQEHEHTCSGS